MEKSNVIFITGGVRSGKSSFAEQLAAEHAVASAGNLHYIACGIPFDQEMRDRVERHQYDREQAAASWNTWEQPTDLTEIAPQFTEQDVLLLDCVTTLLNNYLYTKNIKEAERLISLIMEDIKSLMDRAETVIIVSNEVFHDMPQENKMTWDYQYALGKIHQRIVRIADTAIAIESGIPNYKKGLPKI